MFQRVRIRNCCSFFSLTTIFHCQKAFDEAFRLMDECKLSFSFIASVYEGHSVCVARWLMSAIKLGQGNYKFNIRLPVPNPIPFSRLERTRTMFFPRVSKKRSCGEARSLRFEVQSVKGKNDQRNHQLHPNGSAASVLIDNTRCLHLHVFKENPRFGQLDLLRQVNNFASVVMHIDYLDRQNCYHPTVILLSLKSTKTELQTQLPASICSVRLVFFSVFNFNFFFHSLPNLSCCFDAFNVASWGFLLFFYHLPVIS